MAGASKVIRVDSTPAERLAASRAAMDAVGTPPTDEQKASDAALARDVSAYETMTLEAVLEREIKLGLALPYDKLYANARHQLIKAGVGLLAVKNKIGPRFGGGLGGDDEEDDE